MEDLKKVESSETRDKLSRSLQLVAVQDPIATTTKSKGADELIKILHNGDATDLREALCLPG